MNDFDLWIRIRFWDCLCAVQHQYQCHGPFRLKRNSMLHNSFSRHSLPHGNFENEWITSSKPIMEGVRSKTLYNMTAHQTWYKREHWMSEVTWCHDMHNPSRPHLQHGFLFCRLSYVIPLILKRTLSMSVQVRQPGQPSTQKRPPNVAGLLVDFSSQISIHHVT